MSKRGARSARYRRYRREVQKITAENRPGPRPGYTLDHIVPVSYGFKRDIPPDLIGSAANLEMLPYQENIAKGTRITIKARELLDSWGIT